MGGFTVARTVDAVPDEAVAEQLERLRRMPQVDRLLREPCLREVLEAGRLPRSAVVAGARTVLDEARRALAAGGEPDLRVGRLAERSLEAARLAVAPRLQPVVNATGVVLHTNLGRAPLADAAVPSQMVHRIWRELARRLDEDSLAKVSVRLYAYSQGREVDDCRTPGCSSKGSWCERCHGAPWARGGPFAPVVSLLETAPGTLRMKLRHGIKRGLDIVGSVWLLVALAPLFAVAAGLVKCTSPGPVFFRQARVGRRGEPFTMLKFRTMHADIKTGFRPPWRS